jgi:hypothetical protein
MEPLGPNAKRRRSKDVAAGEPPPRTTEATEAANTGSTIHSKEPPPSPPNADGGGGGSDDVDRIRGLLDSVLGEILSLLSTKEAGHTQILASRWRHVWVASPLVLDGADLYNKPKALLGYSSDESSDSCDTDEDEKALTAAYEALACAVTHILSAHPGPVRHFSIPSLYLHNRPTTVDAWLSSPALDNLQELEFCERYDMIWYIAPYPLAPPPPSTFLFSATLRVATFGKCMLPDSSVEGIHFPFLKQLGLEGVSISEGSLHTIISSFPVLECLLLKDSFGVGCLRISSNSLRSIGVRADVSWSGDNPLLLQEVIIVDAPCLERFLYFDAPAYASKAIDLTVISAPKLETIVCLKEDWFCHPRLVFGTTAMQVGMTSFFISMNMF